MWPQPRAYASRAAKSVCRYSDPRPHRAPVVGGRVVLDLERFIKEREARLVGERLRALDVHAGVLRGDVRHPGLWIDRYRLRVLAAEKARTDEDLFVDCRAHCGIGLRNACRAYR